MQIGKIFKYPERFGLAFRRIWRGWQNLPHWSQALLIGLAMLAVGYLAIPLPHPLFPDDYSLVITDRRGEPPLLLLDDVFSELDTERRGALLAALPSGGQTVITATHAPGVAAPDLVVEVAPGEARAAA
jgi:hypothetical protein